MNGQENKQASTTNGQKVVRAGKRVLQVQRVVREILRVTR